MKGERIGNKTQKSAVNSCNMKELRDVSFRWRFYYYQEVKRMRYDDTVESLSLDFYLSEKTVMHYIQQMSKEIDVLHQNRPTVKKVVEANSRFFTFVSKEEKHRYNR